LETSKHVVMNFQNNFGQWKASPTPLIIGAFVFSGYNDLDFGLSIKVILFGLFRWARANQNRRNSIYYDFGKICAKCIKKSSTHWNSFPRLTSKMNWGLSPATEVPEWKLHPQFRKKKSFWLRLKWLNIVGCCDSSNFSVHSLIGQVQRNVKMGSSGMLELWERDVWERLHGWCHCDAIVIKERTGINNNEFHSEVYHGIWNLDTVSGITRGQGGTSVPGISVSGRQMAADQLRNLIKITTVRNASSLTF